LAGAVLDLGYIDAAIERLGPLAVENANSKLPGCR